MIIKNALKGEKDLIRFDKWNFDIMKYAYTHFDFFVFCFLGGDDRNVHSV